MTEDATARWLDVSRLTLEDMALLGHVGEDARVALEQLREWATVYTDRMP